MMVPFTETRDKRQKKQICNGVESREIKSFSLERPIRHSSGDAMWVAGCTRLEFRVEVKGGGRQLGVSVCLCGSWPSFQNQVSAASSRKPSSSHGPFLSFPLS